MPPLISALFLGLLIAPRAPGQSRDLTTLAAASPRPAICRPLRGTTDSELWSRARGEQAKRFCELLARGYAELRGAPSTALKRASEARALRPSEVEPRVLAGRALLRLGNARQAYAELLDSVLAVGRPWGDVAALRELGAASVMSDHLPEAVRAYRALVPRAGFADESAFARLVVLEAAAALMALGPAGSEEARLYLAEARRRTPSPGLEDLTTAFFALALDRSGDAAQVPLVLKELEGPWSLEVFTTPRERARTLKEVLSVAPSEVGVTPNPLFSESLPVLPDGELHAALGLAAMKTDPQFARAHLTAYLDSAGGRGVWAVWTREKLVELGRAKGRLP